MDDCLTGADSVEEALETHKQLQGFFSEAGFVLRKWNSSSPTVLKRIPEELHDSQTSLTIPMPKICIPKRWGLNGTQ